MNRSRLIVLLSLLFVCLLAGVISAGSTRASAAFSVTSPLDEVDASPGDGICASAPSGVCTLRAAVMETNALSGADTIHLPAGVYTLTLAGTGENGAATGDLDICGDLTLAGSGAAAAIINANGIDRVADVICGDIAVTLSGVTLQGGQNPGVSAGEGGGGLRKNNVGDLTLLDSVVFSSTSQDGGGIYNSALGTLTLINTSVLSNTSSNSSGGIYNNGTLFLMTSTVASNSGRGIFNYQGVLTATHSTLAANTGDWGAGIANDGGVVHVVATTISGNATSGAFEPGGGGLYNTNGVITLTNSTLSGNTAAGGGGGIYNFRFGASDGRVYLYNVTVSGNSADQNDDGGGDGGGIFNSGGWVYASNSLLGANSDPGQEAPDFSGTLTSQGYNLIQSAAGSTITGSLTGTVTGLNPNLGPLQDNGGPTLSQALLPGSPAIDAGNPSGCLDHLGAALPEDQRGEARHVDGGAGSARCDLGAYEYSPGAATATPTRTPTPGPSLTPSRTLTPSPTPTPSRTPTDTPIPPGAELFLPLVQG